MLHNVDGSLFEKQAQLEKFLAAPAEELPIWHIRTSGNSLDARGRASKFMPACKEGVPRWASNLFLEEYALFGDFAY